MEMVLRANPDFGKTLRSQPGPFKSGREDGADDLSPAVARQFADALDAADPDEAGPFLVELARGPSAHGLDPRGPAHPRTHDGTIIPDRVDEMWGTGLTAAWTGQGQPPCSSPSTTVRPHASASILPSMRCASRCWSRSARVCAATSGRSRRTRPTVCLSATTMEASTCPTPSRRNSPSSASRVRPLSCERRRAMAAPSASSASRKRTCSGKEDLLGRAFGTVE
jgi:hypothetical protein